MPEQACARRRILPLPPVVSIRATVARALHEDIGSGDVTAQLLPEGACAHASVICREAAVISGAPWFDECFTQLDPEIDIQWHVADGDAVAANTLLCTVHGRARTLVTGERTAINFLQTLSATATISARYAAAVKDTHARVLDTRKTLPGLREAQKYAVRCGGAWNHRQGLHDAYLIKENHIAAAGSIAKAIQAARSQHPDLLLEVEVETLDELEQTLEAGADRIMLDDFSHEQLLQAVQRTAGKMPLEVSGNVTLEQITAIAETGVDFISVGALTKHVRAIDLSMRLEMEQAEPAETG